MRTSLMFLLIYSVIIVLAIVYINSDIKTQEQKPKPCEETGFTRISEDSVITNCGRKIARKHYRPFDK